MKITHQRVIGIIVLVTHKLAKAPERSRVDIMHSARSGAIEYAQRDEEILGLTPAQAASKTGVVVVERMRNDEMRPAVIVDPIGQFVVVGVAVIKEPAFFNNQAPCIGARRADVPADRPRSGQSPNGLDGEENMLALDCFIDAL